MRFLLIFLSFFLFFSAGNADEITIMSYNLHNYFVAGEEGGEPKTDSSKRALMKVIQSANPDIFFAVELGGEKALADLMDNLKKSGCDYLFSKEITGADDTRHIALIAKFAPLKFEEKNNLYYRIKPKDSAKNFQEKVFVERGFIHAVFEFGKNYRLHILGAHLKSRLFHPRYNQTDMRRYEARLCRYLVNRIQEDEKDANILVIGDFNDIYISDPLVTLRAPEKSFDKRLYDLRPRDSLGMAWTHWWNQEDVYGRIDYALCSPALIPEIDFNKTKIIHVPECWMFASDHRPLFLTINTKDSPLWPEDKIEKLFSEGIYRQSAPENVIPQP